MLYFRWVDLDPARFFKLIRITAVSLSVWCGFALVHYFIIRQDITITLFNTEIIKFIRTNSVDRQPLLSIFQQPSKGGNLIAVVSAFVISYLIVEWGKIKRSDKILFIASLIIAFITIFMTYTRGALIFFGTALFFLTLFARKWKLILLMAVLAIIVFFSPIDKFRSTFHDPLNSPNAPGRLLQYKAGFEMFSKYRVFSNPNIFLGMGLLNFPFQFESNYSDDPEYEPVPFIHNNYIALLVETGIIGFITFFGFIAFTVVVLIRKNYNKWSASKILATVFIFGFLANSLFDALLYTVPVGIFLWIVIGLSQNQSLEMKQDLPAGNKPPETAGNLEMKK